MAAFAPSAARSEEELVAPPPGRCPRRRAYDWQWLTDVGSYRQLAAHGAHRGEVALEELGVGVEYRVGHRWLHGEG